VGQIAFTNSGAQRMVTTKQYDLLNRVTNISSVSSVQSVVNFGYQYNSANQRTRRTEADSSYWVYNYDSLGQVIGGRKYWSDGTPVAGQQFTYAFDDIGNRQTTASGGDQSGGNLHSATYTANNLNQYSSRTVPAFLNDLGTANSNATVTLWNSDGTFAQAYRHGEYFRNELAVTNGSSALWPTLTNLAVLSNGTNADIVTNTVGNAFVPKTPEPFAYDADGNLVSNGRWTNHWDAENRLVSMESLTNTPAASKRRLTFGYDHQGRRITKSVETWNGATWTIIVSNRFLFDGWNLIAELNATNNAVIRSYLWGLDVSGTIRGAGGVGGLMAVSDSVQGVHFVAFDGNGNAAALTRATDGTTSATYEYGAFGEVIRATGPTARVSPFRWSTKYQDDETDLLYYGRRSLNASTGRFLSKDPIEEQGGLNPYTFALNRPLDVLDILGLGNYKLGGPTEPPMAFDEDFVYDPNAKATAGDYLAWTKWGGMLLASDLLRHDLSDANAAYAHYRDGTGTDMDIDYEKAYRDDSNIHGGLNNEIASAEAEAERLAASGGPHFTMTGDAVRMGQPITEDWQKTIGGHWLWGSATVEQCAGKFTMTITLHEKDRYNFNRGASDIATGLPDNANGRFAVLGWAKSFITNGKVVKKVTWQKGQESSTTNIENLPRR
jgi:RHS repeat-associated protein